MLQSMVKQQKAEMFAIANLQYESAYDHHISPLSVLLQLYSRAEATQLLFYYPVV